MQNSHLHVMSEHMQKTVRALSALHPTPRAVRNCEAAWGQILWYIFVISFQ